MAGQGALPLPGQSPGLGKLPTTGQEPIAATNKQGKTFMQFAWDQLMEGKDPKTMSKDIDAFKAKLMESGRTAFADPEKFDPSAPTKAAWNVMTGGMGMAEKGALGAAGGRMTQPTRLAPDVPAAGRAVTRGHNCRRRCWPTSGGSRPGCPLRSRLRSNRLPISA